ncbi:MAG: hypothetical protein ACQEWU_05660 [Bacillota bacterium]|uniref:Uncharacterized protein n=1 Tax=Virgibacillus salarius TaxID=447199 RepID=A0A941DX78_9BACI|nr:MULTISPECIES: hypothetical protein [Bacillaceae]NAZ08536.1 hypothetical protein [Agaribacter marinus]MBR7795823.1 hypothetical protein [Virgibacillus salarius]MCC2250194.1 hypothetical protein [Virgibacillus sp. AGTR]MDY7044268.1 hypothetical protein [Virgibacillus sp. M23]QRZ17695.1 hypothetical protein JUJ52_18390 [Virgibacillus sp. AGTR]
MLVMNHRRMRDEKIARLKEGHSAYAESHELIRLIKRDIEKEHLDVIYDNTNSGCWFIPNSNRKSS